MRRCLLLILTATLSLAFAPAPFPKFQRPSRAAAIAPLEGRWDGVQWLLVTPTRLTYHAGQASQGYDLRFDPRARPATYDLREDGSGRGFLGIYRIDGDTLTFCYNEEGKGRPTAFDGPGKGQFTEVYKRKHP
jgi:uncharacterized protein (TIGR03067 family)